MYIYNDSNSISGTIAPGESLFKHCVKKQADFGTADSCKKKKYSTHAYKEVFSSLTIDAKKVVSRRRFEQF